MQAHEIIKRKITDNGIKQTFVAEKAGMSRELLRRSLDGTRTMKADEFIKICRTLSMDLKDFEETEK